MLNRLDAVDAARILEALSEEDRLLAWEQIKEDRLDSILLLLARRRARGTAQRLEAPEREGLAQRLRAARRPAAPGKGREQGGPRQRQADLGGPGGAVGRNALLGRASTSACDLPDPDSLTDLEASARFYVEDNGEIHLHSDFLLDADDDTQNVAVAFILHKDILFSVRKEELPVFRLQRLRARTQPGYVTEGKDVLLDLYAADAEYSADVLEEVYAELEHVGKSVLNPQVTDDAAAQILSEIARTEDLNGRIRRNVLDTRRALSFLMRGKFLSPQQYEEARQIVRDIESLDGHTTFLFGKINFLMDATVGFININQNKRVSKLTTISIIFMPINILAGIGGMSEFSMMTERPRHSVAGRLAGIFLVGSALIGWATYTAIRAYEARQAKKMLEATGHAKLG